MKTNDTKWMQPVMSVIAHADPKLFREIEEADWPVTVIDGPWDLIPLAERVDPGMIAGLADNLARANGVTWTLLPDTSADLRAEARQTIGNAPTFLNRPYIDVEAEDLGVPAEQFAATTLVHEFTHHNGAHTETPAYDAAIAFSRKLGQPALVKRNEDARRDHL